MYSRLVKVISILKKYPNISQKYLSILLGFCSHAKNSQILLKFLKILKMSHGNMQKNVRDLQKS